MAPGTLPRISIVTPSYNQGRFLEQAMLSVLEQGYPNLEYIVIDGGSGDQSRDIIGKYADSLAFWCSEADEGHYHAVNKGFERATGEIYAWLNSDDMYVPGALEAVASAFMAFPDMQWLTTTNQLLWDRDGKCKRRLHVPGYARQAFLDGRYLQGRGYWLGFIQQESTFWSRTLWERAGPLDTSLDLAADFDLWCRFYRTAELYGMNQTLAGFRLHDSNRSADLERYLAEALQSLETFRKESGWDGRERGPAYLDTLCRIPKMRGVLRHLRRWKVMGGRYQAFNLQRSRTSQWERALVRF